MSKGKVIAWEQDANLVRYVVGGIDGGQLVIHSAASLTAEGGAASPAALGALLEQAHAARSDAIAVLNRSAGEVRQFRLPPAPEDELPDMLKFVAGRHFASYDETWLLDFVPLQRGEEGVEVIAAAVPPAVMQRVRQTCEVAQLGLKQSVLRPFAAAALWRHLEPRKSALLVQFNQFETDLTIVSGNNAVSTRTVRRPAQRDQELAWLAAEVRRTKAACRDVEPEMLVIFGAENQSLALAVGQQLDMPAQVCAPFQALAAEEPQSDSGAYAGLLGALLEYAGGTRPAIDFVSPRRKPVPVNRARQFAVVGVAAGLLLLTAVVVGWIHSNNLKSKVKLLAAERVKLGKELETTAETLLQVAAVDEFLANDINWLTELEQVSVRGLDPNQILVSSFSGSVGSVPGGRLVVSGWASSNDLIGALESKLRDSRHSVYGRGGSLDANSQKWRFGETILIEPEPRPDLEDLLPSNTAGPPDVADNAAATSPTATANQPTSELPAVPEAVPAASPEAPETPAATNADPSDTDHPPAPASDASAGAAEEVSS